MTCSTAPAGLLVWLLATGHTGTFHTARSSSTRNPIAACQSHRLGLIGVSLSLLSANLGLSSVHPQTLSRGKLSSFPSPVSGASSSIKQRCLFKTGVWTKNPRETPGSHHPCRPTHSKQPTLYTLCAQCFPTLLAEAKEWGGHGLSMDPRVSGAISSAACWGNRHCYGNNCHSSKFQGVQNRSSHSGQQLRGSPASGQKAPRGPITWEGTHGEASHSVATGTSWVGKAFHSKCPGHGRM